MNAIDGEKRVIISKQYLKDIGNAIRNKLGTYNKTYKPSEMADAIRSIQTNTFVTSFLRDKTAIYSGTIGGCTWEISSKGVLFIYAGLLPDSCRGTCKAGEDFTLSLSKTSSPWYEFRNNIKLISFEGPVIAGPDISYLFQGLEKLWLINSMNYLNLTNTTNMSYMFQNCTGLAGIDFSTNNFTNITDMSYIFNNCSRLIEVKFPDIDFVDYHCGYNVQNLDSAFTSCVLLPRIDLSFLSDGKNISSMRMIFDNCQSLESIIARFERLAKLTTLESAFRKCLKLTDLDTSRWQTTGVLKNLKETFNTCPLLTSINLTNFDISGVTTLANLFNGCTSLAKIITDKGLMFASNADVSLMFNNCSAHLDTRLWDTSEMRTFASFFEGWLGDQELDFSLWDTANVTDMSRMFCGCKNIEKVNLFNFEPYNCGKMNSMFKDCSNLKFENITFFYDLDSTAQNLREVNSMFANCVEFEEFYFPFSTYSVWDFKNMLSGCYKIKVIDFTSWTMGGPEVGKGQADAQSMLANCTNLRILYIGNSYDPGIFKPNECTITMSASGEIVERCTYYTPCFPVYMYEAQASIQITPNQIKTVDKPIPQGIKTYYGIGALVTGTVFNTRIKTLVSGNKVDNASNGDNIVKTIVFRTATGTENEEFFNNNEKWIGVGSYTNYAGVYASWDEESQTITVATGERFCLLNPDSSHMFQRFTALEEIQSLALNSQIVTNLNTAFENCYSIESFDFSAWKTPSLLDMGNCFSGCRSLREIDLTVFDATSLSSIISLFSGATALETITFFENVSKALVAQEAFASCENLTTFNAFDDIEFIDSGSYSGLNMAFFNCKSLETLNLTHWKTNNIKNLVGVFNGCVNLKSLDISTWAINSEINSMASLFENCSSLYDLKFWSETLLDDRAWYDYIKPKNISKMFYNCQKLGTTQEEVDGELVYRPGTFTFPRIHLENATNVTNASQRIAAQNVLVGCYGIETLDLTNLQIITTMPLDNSNLLEANNLDDLSYWNNNITQAFSFERDEEKKKDRVTVTSVGGWEKLYINIRVEKNTGYSWVFKCNTPEGTSGNAQFYVTGFSNNTWQDSYNISTSDYRYYLIGQTRTIAGNISSEPTEYILDFDSGNYTEVRLFFNFGPLKDGQTKPFEFYDMALYLNNSNSLPDTTNFVTNQSGRKGLYNLSTIITGEKQIVERIDEQTGEKIEEEATIGGLLGGHLYNNNNFIARIPSIANITYTRQSDGKVYNAIPANTADTYTINYLPDMGEDELGG